MRFFPHTVILGSGVPGASPEDRRMDYESLFRGWDCWQRDWDTEAVKEVLKGKIKKFPFEISIVMLFDLVEGVIFAIYPWETQAKKMDYRNHKFGHVLNCVVAELDLYADKRLIDLATDRYPELPL